MNIGYCRGASFWVKKIWVTQLQDKKAEIKKQQALPGWQSGTIDIGNTSLVVKRPVLPLPCTRFDGPKSFQFRREPHPNKPNQTPHLRCSPPKLIP